MTPARTAIAVLLIATLSACGVTKAFISDRAKSVEIVVPSTVLQVGDRILPNLLAKDGAGDEIVGRAANWSSTDTQVLEVFPSGLVVARWPGRAGIIAKMDRVADTLMVEVQSAVRSARVLAGPLRLTLGDEYRLHVTGFDEFGVRVNRAIAFRVSSSDPSVIASDGPTMHAMTLGEARISINAEGVEDTLDGSVSYASFAKISSGENFACGLTATGEALCWGSNSSSQLGIITPTVCTGSGSQYCGITGKNLPVYVDTPLLFEQIDAGGRYVCALTFENRAYCWGNDDHGQVGTSQPNDGCRDDITHAGGSCIRSPVPVEGDLRFASISTGATKTCGITLDGGTYCWGYGLVGDGTTQASSVPKMVAGGHAFTQVSAGDGHSCALTVSGVAYCWGNNDDGQLGVGAPGSAALVPVAVSGAHTFQQIGVAASSTCGLTTEARMYCWGSGALGTQAPATCRTPSDTTTERPCAPYPIPVNTDVTFASMVAASNMTCGITGEGAAFCWGYNRVDPAPVSGMPPLVSASGGGFVKACGIAVDGQAYCWSDLHAQKAPGQQ